MDSVSELSHGFSIRIQLASANLPLIILKSPRLFLVDTIGVAQVSSMCWPAIEEAVTELHATNGAELYVPRLDTFAWLADAVSAGTVLRRLRHSKKFVVTHRYVPRITLDSVLALPVTYSVDGNTVILKHPQIVKLMYCQTEDEKLKFLRGVLQALSAPEAVSGICNTQSDGASLS